MKPLKMMITAISLLLANVGFAVPASTDYVNQRINDTTNTWNNTLQQAVIALTNNINALRIPPHKVGEHYQGGIIFFVDDTGLHGLIAALKDANNGEYVQWQNGESGEKITNAHAVGIGAGATNTKLIVAQQTIDYQMGNFAALAASNFSVMADGKTPCTTSANPSKICYGDWYLSSIYELDLMRLALHNQGHLKETFYWSSTESTVSEAYVEDMQTGSQVSIDKASAAVIVRAIRAF